MRVDRQTLIAAAAVGVMVATSAGCAKSEPGSQKIAGVESESVSSEERVKKDYLAYWDALEKAHETSNPDYPELKRYAVGKKYKDSWTAVAYMRSIGRFLKGAVGHQIVVKNVSAKEATVEDCPDTASRRRYVKETGALDATQPKKELRRLTYTLVVVDGVWAIQEAKVLGPCE